MLSTGKEIADKPKPARKRRHEHFFDFTALLGAGKTYVHFLAKHRVVKIISAIVVDGAPVDPRTAEGWTPLHYAAATFWDWRSSAETIRELLTAGADIEARTCDGQTPLVLSTRAGDLEGAMLLVRSGAVATVSQSDGHTPLHFAALTFLTGVCAGLIRAGADVDARVGVAHPEMAGATPLHMAALHKVGYDRLQCTCNLRALIDGGADTNARRFTDGSTALHLAVGVSSGLAKAVIDGLIDAGVDVSAARTDGSTALHIAASAHSSGDVVRALVSAGADVDARDVDGAAPLHIAMQTGSTMVCEALVKAGADVNAALPRNGYTPLHTAVASWDCGCYTAFLIAAGANANATAAGGETPLHVAASNGKVASCLRLLNAGADVNARSFEGLTPFQLAARNSNQDLAQLLVGAEADGASSEFSRPAAPRPSCPHKARLAAFLCPDGQRHRKFWS